MLRLRLHQGREAEQLLARALATYERALGNEHPDMVPMNLAYARALHGLHRNREASQYEKRARAIQTSRATEDGRLTIDAQTIAARDNR